MSGALSKPAAWQSATRALDPEVMRLLEELKPGDPLRITQRVRVGSTGQWSAPVEGVFRSINYLATGLATDRVPEDDILVITVHFTKKNGELSSVALDEHTRIERI